MIPTQLQGGAGHERQRAYDMLYKVAKGGLHASAKDCEAMWGCAAPWGCRESRSMAIEERLWVLAGSWEPNSLPNLSRVSEFNSETPMTPNLGGKPWTMCRTTRCGKVECKECSDRLQQWAVDKLYETDPIAYENAFLGKGKGKCCRQR